MNVRNESPFPTEKCDNHDFCNNTIPKSSRSGLCSSCGNYSQLFGEYPSEDVSHSVELEKTTSDPDKWEIVVFRNGEQTDTVGPFYSEKNAKHRHRERKGSAGYPDRV